MDVGSDIWRRPFSEIPNLATGGRESYARWQNLFGRRRQIGIGQNQNQIGTDVRGSGHDSITQNGLKHSL